MAKTTEKKNSAILDRIQKIYSAQAIESKDFNMKHLFTIENAKAKKYQQEDGTALLPIIGIASKHVPKYDSDHCRGFHTTLYLENGEKTGSFSDALLGFAEFFYDLANLPMGDYRNLNDFDAPIMVRVSKVELTEGKTTYNFEVVGGDFTRPNTIMGGSALYAGLIGTAEIPALNSAE